MFTCIKRYMCVSERSNTNTVSAEIENPRSTKGMYKLYLRMFRRHEGNYVYWSIFVLQNLSIINY